MVEWYTYSVSGTSSCIDMKTQLIIMTSIINKLNAGWVRMRMAPLRIGLNGVSRNMAFVALNLNMFLSLPTTIKF